MDRKQLKKALGATGWMALIYNLLMTGCVLVTVLVEMIISMIVTVAGGHFDEQSIFSAVMGASTSAWGYFVTAAVGILILLLWKKPRYWKEELWAKGKPMTGGDFSGILFVFLSVQFIYLIYATALEMFFNGMGFSLMEGMESVSGDVDVLSMFLYMGVLAPVAEELLFRGLIQRTLMPYGKKLAILGSAFLFGMMHGNILQTPFAFMAGLVLGYVATEYSIAWAMLLHMINNLVLGDMLTRLTRGLGEMGASAVLWLLLIMFVIGAIVTMIRKRGEIRSWMQTNVLGPTYTRCFFGSAGVVTFTVWMGLSIIATLFLLVVPI